MPRLTVRRLMLVAAVLCLGLGVLAERRAGFRRIAATHRAYRPPPSDAPGSSVSRRGLWSIRMQEKYERAARSPWLPVPPDPPMPE